MPDELTQGTLFQVLPAEEPRSLDGADGAESFIGDMRALVGGLVGDQNVAALSEPALRAASSVLLERMMYARQAGISYHGKRDMYEILGYNRILTYREYRGRYLRGGLAKRIVDAYPVAVWRGGAEVYEDEDPKTETEFETAWKKFDQRLAVWSRFQRVHTLSSLSTYAVLLIGTSLDPDMSNPLPKGTTTDQIIYVQPFSGGGGPGGGDQQDNRSRAMNADCTIMEFETDSTNPRFGMPKYYQLKRTSVDAPMLQRPVHWSRIIHVSEGLLGDEVYGTPALESVWNLLDDLDKVVGGGAEAFWLRANAGLHIDVDKTMGLAGKPGAPVTGGLSPEQQAGLQHKAENLQHQLERVMVTRGVNVTPLTSAVANFKDPADAIVTQIAGTKAIPKRILVGSEMGQLASGQDKDNWNTQVQDKRTSWAFTNVVKPFIDRLVEYGYLPQPKEIHVEWPIIEDLTEDEKVKMTLDMANANKIQGGVVYTEDEMREIAGREPLDELSETDQLSEMEKADVALKLAQTNKAMGITVFTDDEIRNISYGKLALSDAEKVPIGSPEKISVTAPPKLGEDGEPIEQEGQDPAPPAAPPKPALLAATIRELEAAIEADDLEAIGEILALSNPEGINQYADSRAIPKNPDVPHGTVVAKSKYGSIVATRQNAAQPARFKAVRKGDEHAGTFNSTHAAADALREPKNKDSFASGYRSPDVPWKAGA